MCDIENSSNAKLLASLSVLKKFKEPETKTNRVTIYICIIGLLLTISLLDLSLALHGRH